MARLPRGLVLVACGALLTFVQTALELGDQPPWAHVLAAVLVAGIAVVSEIERHRAQRSQEATGGRSGASVAADRLAEVVGDTWAAEASRRGLNAPAPASVRWHWGSEQVAVPREDVISASTRGLTLGELPGGSGGGKSMPGLMHSGVVTRLYDEVYARLPHGRLVVLGAPGAGKTGAMILMLLEAVQHRAGTDEAERAQIPVPVWLTLGGWDPVSQPLREWALTVIDRDHPYLRAEMYGPGAAKALLESGRLALFLDGLDEMAPEARGTALRRLDAETANLRVVLSSRPDEYQQALEQGLFHNAAVIEIRPVRSTVAASFLTRGHIGRQRTAWAAVGEYLRDNPGSIAAQVLDTPLTLSLARSVYQHADPTELMSQSRFTSAAALREELIVRTLEAAYPDETQRSRATRQLSWLAHRMGSDRDLAWWAIPTWVPRWKLQLVTVLTATLAGVLTLLVAAILLDVFFPTKTTFFTGGRIESDESLPAKGLVQGLLLPLGVVGGLAAWFGSQLVLRRAQRLSRPLRLIPRLPRAGEYAWLLRAAFVVAVGLGTGVGLLSGLGSVALDVLDRATTDGLGADVVDSEDLSAALQVVLAVGLGIGLPAGLVVGALGLWSTPDVRAAAASPWSTYVGDRWARAAISLIGGGAVGLSVGITAAVTFGVTPGLVYGAIAGVAVALLGRLLFGVASALRATEFILRAPRIMPLLENALDREVLRRAGAVYQFRHADLQDHLARTYQQEHGVPPLPERKGGAWELWFPRRWRLALGASLAVAVVLAAAGAVAPAISAMLAPDHVTLTNTPGDNVAFSPDGGLLVASGDRESVVWDVGTEQRLGIFPGEAVGSRTDVASLDPSADELAFSPDGNTLATAEGPVVRWWNVRTEERVRTLRLPEGVEVLGFSPDRDVLAALHAGSGFVGLADASSGAITGAFQVWEAGGWEDHRLALAFNPDGRTVATSVQASDALEGALTRVWSVPEATWIGDLPGGAPSFSDDGEILAVNDDEGLHIHDATSLAALDHIGVETGVTLGPGDILTSGEPGVGSPDSLVNEGGRLKVWERDSNIRVRILDSPPDKLLTWLTTFDAEGTRVATGWVESGWNLDTYLLVWDVTGDQAPQRLGRGNRQLQSMAFAEDGRTLATGWEDNRVRIWTLSAR